MNSDILYKRLLSFGQRNLKLVILLPKTIYNIEYGKQSIRSSASPGANYIEAIEAMSRKDFIHRLKICLKEVKETVHWLLLIKSANPENNEVQKESDNLISEAHELIRILAASILTAGKNREVKR